MLMRILLVVIFTLGLCANAGALSESAESSVVINATTREIIHSKNPNMRLANASTTKIMTAIIALENASSKDIFTVSENAQNQEGSSVYLRSGDEYTMYELLLALMLNSGNDAAVTLAENIAGTEDAFVIMMNEKASEIGCKNTNFVNSSGLPDEKHYSTAYDMALIMAYAMENDLLCEVMSTREYQLKKDNSITYLKNHNKLLWQYENCIGGKTGYTKNAGRCLVSASEKDGKRVVCVTLNDKDDWNTHKSLSEFALGKIEKVRIIKAYDILTTKKIKKVPVNLLSGADVDIFTSGKGRRNLVCRIFLDEVLKNDIFIGDKIGSANLYYKDYLIASFPLLCGTEINIRPDNVFIDNTRYILNHLLLKKT